MYHVAPAATAYRAGYISLHFTLFIIVHDPVHECLETVSAFRAQGVNFLSFYFLILCHNTSPFGLRNLYYTDEARILNRFLSHDPFRSFPLLIHDYEIDKIIVVVSKPGFFITTGE
jgi:hypothetical protein